MAADEDDPIEDEGAISSFSFLAEGEASLPDEPSDNETGFSFLGQPLAEATSEGHHSPAQLISMDSEEKNELPGSVLQSSPTLLNTISSIRSCAQTSSTGAPQKPTPETGPTPATPGTGPTPGTGEKKKKRRAFRPGQQTSNVSSSALSTVAPENPQETCILQDSASSALSTENPQETGKIPQSLQDSASSALSTENPQETGKMPQSLQDSAASSVPFQHLNRSVQDPAQQELVREQVMSLSQNDEGSTPIGSLVHDDKLTLETDTSSVKHPVDENTPKEKSCAGNYTVQFTPEESLAGMLESYTSGLARLR